MGGVDVFVNNSGTGDGTKFLELNYQTWAGTLDTNLNGAFMSRHSGGANFVLADGSVRFVASPRHADVLMVTGPVTKNMREALERRWGAPAGISVAAAIFAVIHVLPWVFPLHFFLGLAFGYAVYATRSIWSGAMP